MWMLLILAIALVLGLCSMPTRRVRVAMVPVTLTVVAYQALKYGLL